MPHGLRASAVDADADNIIIDLSDDDAKRRLIYFSIRSFVILCDDLMLIASWTLLDKISPYRLHRRHESVQPASAPSKLQKKKYL